MEKKIKSFATAEDVSSVEMEEMLLTCLDKDSPIKKDVLTSKMAEMSSEAEKHVDEILSSLAGKFFIAVKNGLVYSVHNKEIVSSESFNKAKQGIDHNSLLELLKDGFWHPAMDKYGMSKGETSQEEFRDDIDLGVDSYYKLNNEALSKLSNAVDSIEALDIAKEIGDWLQNNVEQFIDNQQKVFRVYLAVESNNAMPTCSLYQEKYTFIVGEDSAKLPDNYMSYSDKERDSLLEKLDLKLLQAKNSLNENEELMKALYDKMSYYYENSKIAVKDGQIVSVLHQAMEGSVSVNELFFDPIPYEIIVTGEQRDEGHKGCEEDVRRTFMPAGFGIEVEILIRPKIKPSLSMY